MEKRAPIWFGLLFLATGLFIIAAAIWAEGSGFQAPRWVVGAAGGTFALAGLLVLLEGNRLMTGWLQALLITAFAAVFLWVSFGPGERSFSSTFSLPFISFSGPASELFGRMCFAPGAIGLTALAVYLWVRLAGAWLE